MVKHQLSQATHQRLTAEIAYLEDTKLPEVAQKIGRAREMGDLRENGDYHAAKDEYGFLNDRKNLIQGVLQESEIAPEPVAGVVGWLSSVTVLFDGDDPSDAEKYLIGHIEERVDGVEVMSPSSPIGKALMGQESGATVEVTLENGATVVVEIKSVT
ncbi:MAG: transcription elongation factor GreA [Ilumatobacteraceae bacterium]|nr:transcription elongation factor GreA [Ilumatobacteraceae bacterium]